MATSRFSVVEQAPPIEVFALSRQCTEDPHPNKVDLTVGAYRTEEGKPWVLPIVRNVEKQMAEDATLTKEYLPVAGLADFSNAGMKLVLGDDHPVITQNMAGAVQALGGTGAIRLGAEFLNKQLGYNKVYVPVPTWGNHIGIFQSAGYEIHKYRYWDEMNRSLDIDGMLQDISGAPENAVIILHGVAHNPTGIDPTSDQWKQIRNVIREKKQFPFIDFAYQGFGSGDVDVDAEAVRAFCSQGFETFIAQSFSKNFGLYNERCGNLIYVVNDSTVLPRVKSQMELIVRRMWSNPPSHGARIIATVLNNPAHVAEWKGNVKTMADRILLMRKHLFEKLRALGTPGTWNHIIEQQGMFSFTGLNARQCDFLMKQYHVYLMKNGRINMCGLTSKNIDYIATAIHEAVTTVSGDPKL